MSMWTPLTVGLVREINNHTSGMKLMHDLFVIKCQRIGCRAEFTADLARYFSPHDSETFACAHCDHPWMALKPADHGIALSLAQRRPGKVAA